LIVLTRLTQEIEDCCAITERNFRSSGSKHSRPKRGMLFNPLRNCRNIEHYVAISLCSSRYWAAKAPPFKVELRLNPSQSKAATDTGSSRNATTPFCEVAKFQRNNVSTKKKRSDQFTAKTIGRVYTRAVQGRMVVVAL
jgi:hypothetical protein